MRRVRSRVEISNNLPRVEHSLGKSVHGPNRCLPVLYAAGYTLFRKQHLPSLGVKLWKFFQEALEGTHTCAG